MKIPRYKPKVTQHIIILFAVIIAMLNLSANKLTVHAETGDYAALAKAILADSKGSGSSGGTTATTNGVSYTRTGYLCYMLTVDGQTVPGTNAKAFKSPGYNGISGSTWMCKSRKGGYSASSWTATAPWNCTPWAEGGARTNEPNIKAWMTETDSEDVSNGFKFVKDQWGAEVAQRFGDDKLILVVETIMNFQWSTTGTSSSVTSSPQYRAIGLISGVEEGKLMTLALKAGFINTYKAYYRYKNAEQWTEAREIVHELRRSQTLINAVAKELPPEDEGGSTCILHGKPVIGTLPCLLDYKLSLGLASTRLDSYTNKVACFAEMIESGKAGERAGFEAWTGSTGTKISDAAVKKYGLAMGVYTAHGTPTFTTDTHTWDSDKNPPGSGVEDKAPEPPTSSTPLERKFTIIKSYRVKDKTTGVLEDRGTFKRTQTVATIRIEDEPLNTTDKNYKVIFQNVLFKNQVNTPNLIYIFL